MRVKLSNKHIYISLLLYLSFNWKSKYLKRFDPQVIHVFNNQEERKTQQLILNTKHALLHCLVDY